MKKVIAILVSLILTVSVAAAFADTLVMATNASFPPYEFVGDDGKIVGIDAEIAEAIATKLGYDFKIDDMSFGSIISAVQSGKASFGMAGMTVTEERKTKVLFSDTYATGIQVVIVKEDSAITSADDLTGEATWKIGVQQDTTGHIYCEDMLGDNWEKYLLPFATGNEAVMALVAGKVDCVVIDKEPAKAYVSVNTGLKILDTAYAVEDYAACFSLKNEALQQQFNQALKELTEDGTVAAIIEKYIPTAAKAE